MNVLLGRNYCHHSEAYYDNAEKHLLMNEDGVCVIPGCLRIADRHKLWDSICFEHEDKRWERNNQGKNKKKECLIVGCMVPIVSDNRGDMDVFCKCHIAAAEKETRDIHIRKYDNPNEYFLSLNGKLGWMCYTHNDEMEYHRLVYNINQLVLHYFPTWSYKYYGTIRRI